MAKKILEVGVKAFIYRNGRYLILHRAKPYPKEHSEFRWLTLEELKKLRHDKYLTPILKELSNSSRIG